MSLRRLRESLSSLPPIFSRCMQRWTLAPSDVPRILQLLHRLGARHLERLERQRQTLGSQRLEQDWGWKVLLKQRH